MQSTRHEGCAALRRAKLGVALARVIANVSGLNNGEILTNESIALEPLHFIYCWNFLR